MAHTPPLPTLVKRLPSGRIPRAAIRKYVDQVVEKFRPEMVILFGSHAYGKPHVDSDVDLLVIMPAKNELSQAIRIRRAVCARFPMDLLVRTPEVLAKRLAWNDWFLKEVVEKGIVLYDASRERMGPQGRCRSTGSEKAVGSPSSRSRDGLFPQSAGRRKVPQGTAARTWPTRTADARL